MIPQKNYSFYSLLIFLLLSSCPIAATIGNIILLHNANGQSVFLFLDIHRDYESGSLSKRQHADFLSYAQALNAHVIAEDLSHYEGSNASLKKDTEDWASSWDDFYYESDLQRETSEIINEVSYYQDFFLVNLIKHCRNNNISCFNVECRHVSGQSNTKDSNISAQVVEQEYQKTIEEIGQEFTKLKKNAANMYVPFLNLCSDKFKMVIAKNNPLMEYLKTQTKTLWDITNKDFIVTLDRVDYTIWYDTELVDLKILIEVYKNRNKQNIFVCAGGAHLINILQEFSELGYKEVPLPHAGVSFNPLPETNFVLDNAPDLKKYFFHAYRHLLICHTCHKQQSNEQAYFTHELQCMRNAQVKKFGYCSALLAAGFGIYKSLC